MSEALIGGLITLLVSGSVLGWIKGRNGQAFMRIGDRVAAGMIAACLLVGTLKFRDAGVHPGLAVGAAAPLVFYSAVLTLTDRKSWFTWLVLLGLLAIFVYLAAWA